MNKEQLEQYIPLTKLFSGVRVYEDKHAQNRTVFLSTDLFNALKDSGFFVDKPKISSGDAVKKLFKDLFDIELNR